jgi:DNA-binding Lrp family transcriptional regulator
MPAAQATQATQGEATEDLKIVTALLSSTTVRAAAEAVGVSESTVYRRLRDPGFRRLLKEQRLRVYGHALSRLQMATEEAVGTLVEVMQDKEAPEQARIKAAVSILELADKGTQPEMVDRKLADPTEDILESLGTF